MTTSSKGDHGDSVLITGFVSQFQFLLFWPVSRKTGNHLFRCERSVSRNRSMPCCVLQQRVDTLSIRSDRKN